MLQMNKFVVKYFIIGASMLNIIGLRHCCFRAYPQYAVHAVPVFLVANIEYLTLETTFSNKNIL